MNKLLIEILQNIPENCTPTIHVTSTEGVIHWGNGDIEYPGELGWVCFFNVEKNNECVKQLSLFVFENDVFYYIEDYVEQSLSEKLTFDLQEFVKFFNV